MIGQLGWIDNPQAVAESEARMCAAGVLTICGDAESTLTGYAKRRISDGMTYSLAQVHETKLGMSQPSFHQSRGTCVDQAGVRTTQDCLYAAISRGLLVTTPTRIARGPVYAMARRRFKYGQSMGKNDGLAGAHWAEIAATVGVYPRRKLGQLDLAKDEEKHAVDWANAGWPAGLDKLGIKIKAHRPRTIDDLEDCIFAGYFAFQCSASYFEGRAANGFATRRSLNGGGHCEENCGVYVDKRGNIQHVRQQSWGDAAPAPQPWSIQPADSPVIQLRLGSYPVHRDDMSKLMEQGETWCVQMVQGFDGVA